MMDLVSALDFIEIGNKSDFYYAARTLLVHEREDLQLFDQAFELFWRKPFVANWSVQWQGLVRKRRSNKPLVTPPPLKEDKEQISVSNYEPADTRSVIEFSRTHTNS